MTWIEIAGYLIGIGLTWVALLWVVSKGWFSEWLDCRKGSDQLPLLMLFIGLWPISIPASALIGLFSGIGMFVATLFEMSFDRASKIGEQRQSELDIPREARSLPIPTARRRRNG